MKLSIITINYNNASGLERTIKSVVAQTRSNIEYIVIDGKSTDESSDIIHSYTDRIDYWVSEPDLGIYNAMNKGIKQAKGEYLLFLNSGDELDSKTDLQTIINELSSNEDIFIFNVELVSGYTKQKKFYPEVLDIKYFFSDTIAHPGALISKKVLIDHGGYNESYKIVSDWAFFVDAICFSKCSYKFIDKDLAIFYHDGISSKPENMDLITHEQRKHIKENYPQLYFLYDILDELADKRNILNHIKNSISVKILKKMKFIGWIKYLDKI